MDGEWVLGEQLGEAFPDLRRIADLPLDSPHIRALAADAAAVRSYRRLRMQESTCAGIQYLTHQEIRDWRGIGGGRLEEIVGFLVSLGNAAPRIAAVLDGSGEAASLAEDSIPEPEGRGVQEGDPHPGARTADPSLVTLAAWVKTVTGGATWGDLFAAAHLRRPDDVASAWSTLLVSEVVHGSVDSADVVLDDFIERQNDARRLVLLRRVIGPERQTLQELGDRLAVSRERVRQLEIQVTHDLRHHFAEADDWRSVRWAVAALVERLGSFAPLTLAEDALPRFSDRTRRIAIWLAGYRCEDDFLRSTGFDLPSAAAMTRIAEDSSVIDEFEVHEFLRSSGVLDEHIDAVLSRVSGVHRVDGQLVAWGTSMTDRAAAVLEVRDEPQEIEELFGLAGGGSLTSFRNRIYEDVRFIRSTKSKVALRAWGGSHYTSVTDLMAQRLASGPMEINQLARELHTTYDVSESSVSMYAYAPMFKVTGETVALRSERDPFVARDKPQTVRGLYRTSEGALIWHVDVDLDVLRGSGRSIPQEIGTFLGLGPGGERVELMNSVERVSVSWQVNSITGPSIGSIRLHAQSVGAGLGDLLRLRFTSAPLALVTERVPTALGAESPSDRIQRLTGLDFATSTDVDALAHAAWTASDELRAVLRKRGDEGVAEAVDEL